MRPDTARLVVALSLAGLFLGLLTGCESGSGSPFTQPTSAETATTTPEAATSTEAPGSTAPAASDPTSTTTTVPPSPTLGLVAPDGWSQSQDGNVVAELAADLTGTDPEGIRVVDVTSLDPADFLFEPTDNTSSEVAGDWDATVAGYTALGVTLTERSPSDRFRITTFLAIDTGDATAQMFLLQAPAVGYYEVEELLLTTIQPRS